MCYTPQTSINTFVLNIIGCIILYKYSYNVNPEHSKDIKIIALILLFTGLMQLYDYIFWINNRNKINEITTKIAMLTNHLQPIVLLLLIYYFKGKINNFSKYFIIFYIIIITYYSINNYNDYKYTQVTQKSAPGLYWEWNYGKHNNVVYTIFFITLIIVIMKNISYPMNIISSFLIATIFAFTIYKYRINLSSGRFWCYYVSLLPIIIILIHKFVIKKTIIS